LRSKKVKKYQRLLNRTTLLMTASNALNPMSH
jgi:hypothetical protein